MTDLSGLQAVSESTQWHDASVIGASALEGVVATCSADGTVKVR